MNGHILLHFSFSVSSVTVYNDEVYEDESKYNKNNHTTLDTITFVQKVRGKLIQSGLAIVRRLFKSST
jgi:hypothetical protein